MVTFGHRKAKGDLKTPQNLLLQGGFPQGGLMEAPSKAGIFFVPLQSLLPTLKTLRYESK